MKWIYEGTEISYPEARRLEALGIAKVDTAVPSVGNMTSGASEDWIVRMRPVLADFLQYLYDQADKVSLKLNVDAPYISDYLDKKRSGSDETA